MVWRLQQIGSGMGAIALVLAVRWLGWLQAAELGVLDVFLRGRWPEAPDDRIVLVAIDKSDIDRLGGYPLEPQRLSQLLTKLASQQPAAIGLNLRSNDLDLFDPLAAEPLLAQLAVSERVFAIEKAYKPFTFPLLADIEPARVGFSDVPLDRGGGVRRVLLGAPPDGEYRDPEAVYLFSLSARLASHYLAARGTPLENGRRDPQTMRYGGVELPRVLPNYGGYRSADAGGTQILLDPRRNRAPFPRFTWHEVLADAVPPGQLRDRLILVGITDGRYSEAIPIPALGQRVTGLELQAHATSQILSSVLDGRPLLHAWTEIGEILWIGLWGGLGIWLGLEVPTKLGLFGIATERISPASVLAGNSGKVLVWTGLLVGSSYGFLVLMGLWVPVVPAALATILNGLLPSLYALYRFNRDLRDRLKEVRERQRTLEETFNLIHNGPLQRLALLLRGIRDDRLVKAEIVPELEQLNRELRQIIQDLAPATTGERGEALRLGSGQKIDLELPLHELFDLVYRSTLERDFPGFASLKLQVRDFEPLDETCLTPELKRQLCQFLEEALCNVGKHARQPSRIEAIGRNDAEHPLWYVLQIVDNGDREAPEAAEVGVAPTGHGRFRNSYSLAGLTGSSGGSGTRQAQKLAARLKGHFQRQPRPRKGTLCQLRWPQRRIFRK